MFNNNSDSYNNIFGNNNFGNNNFGNIDNIDNNYFDLKIIIIIFVILCLVGLIVWYFVFFEKNTASTINSDIIKGINAVSSMLNNAPTFSASTTAAPTKAAPTTVPITTAPITAASTTTAPITAASTTTAPTYNMISNNDYADDIIDTKNGNMFCQQACNINNNCIGYTIDSKGQPLIETCWLKSKLSKPSYNKSRNTFYKNTIIIPPTAAPD